MSGRILLVDDNREFLDSVRDVLEGEGYSVATAATGEGALRLVETQTFDVVLMDIVMPGMNGVECLAEIKKRTPGTPVIMVTAYSVESRIRQALDHGAYAVLSKPLDMAKLFETVDEARSSGNGGMVLVADGDQQLCDSMIDILGGHGYDVCVAYDGEEAVRKAESRPFDILLVDVKLPLLNGLETYRQIKALRPNTVAIIISGYTEEMDTLIQEALKESARTCLVKPVDMGQLLGLLAEVMTAKRNGTYRKP